MQAHDDVGELRGHLAQSRAGGLGAHAQIAHLLAQLGHAPQGVGVGHACHGLPGLVGLGLHLLHGPGHIAPHSRHGGLCSFGLRSNDAHGISHALAHVGHGNLGLLCLRVHLGQGRPNILPHGGHGPLCLLGLSFNQGKGGVHVLGSYCCDFLDLFKGLNHGLVVGRERDSNVVHSSPPNRLVALCGAGAKDAANVVSHAITVDAFLTKPRRCACRVLRCKVLAHIAR